jgi:hypothetical protein
MEEPWRATSAVRGRERGWIDSVMDSRHGPRLSATRSHLSSSGIQCSTSSPKSACTTNHSLPGSAADDSEGCRQSPGNGRRRHLLGLARALPEGAACSADCRSRNGASPRGALPDVSVAEGEHRLAGALDIRRISPNRRACASRCDLADGRTDQLICARPPSPTAPGSRPGAAALHETIPLGRPARPVPPRAMAAVVPGPAKPVPWPVAGRRLRGNRLPAATATSAAIAAQ